jgi:hypothetical protein
MGLYGSASALGGVVVEDGEFGPGGSEPLGTQPVPDKQGTMGTGHT